MLGTKHIEGDLNGRKSFTLGHRFDYSPTARHIAGGQGAEREVNPEHAIDLWSEVSILKALCIGEAEVFEASRPYTVPTAELRSSLTHRGDRGDDFSSTTDNWSY